MHSSRRQIAISDAPAAARCIKNLKDRWTRANFYFTACGLPEISPLLDFQRQRLDQGMKKIRGFFRCTLCVCVCVFLFVLGGEGGCFARDRHSVISYGACEGFLSTIRQVGFKGSALIVEKRERGTCRSARQRRTNDKRIYI